MQFGNPLVQAERTRDVDIALWLDALFRNVRQAARALVRTPGFTLSVVLTLALGIGANTAVFSAIDAILLQAASRIPRAIGWCSCRRCAARRRRASRRRLGSRTGTALTRRSRRSAATACTTPPDSSRQLPERTRYAGVGPRFLEVLGLSPALGTGLRREGAPVRCSDAVLVSDRFWRDRLARGSRSARPNGAGLRRHRDAVVRSRRRHAALFRVSRPRTSTAGRH